jgi:glucose-6-phosphate isomerase/transaldolase/glucose-6-phosphate isomerase
VGSINFHSAELESILASFDKNNLIGRIWQRDHVVWKPAPNGIVNRLGWLTVAEQMYEKIPSLYSFVRDVRDRGFHTVVLLGMGGSSLGAEVLRQTFGTSRGYLNLIVLDSTVPAEVIAVAEMIEPEHTLFLVSSKSGSTIEPLVLYQYFRRLLNSVRGQHEAGQNFVAITDPGSPLALMAKEQQFLHTFLNLPDLGGRYSVLSYYGLIPAALIGMDIKTLLERAKYMQHECGPGIQFDKNPGAWLGAVIGTMALRGRDKLTLVTSPRIRGFGLWIEQLIAESTGKEGKGIIPVVAEPLVDPKYYGNDRLFIHLRMENDNNSIVDEAVNLIKSSGQPILTLKVQDKYDLGAEFFRWEFATAVAGSILSINPFDQPDVQKSKELMSHILEEYGNTGHLPETSSAASVEELLAELEEGSYFAIMAYVRQTVEVDEALLDLRRRIIQRYCIATTLGYGPRFLHSTGQLHKGGPNNGLFLQLTTEHEKDLLIPGKPYTFGMVVDAQATGDFQALCASGRRVARIHLAYQDNSDIRQLTEKLL